MKEYSRVQAEIDLDAVCHNIEEVRRVVAPQTKIMAVIKADGYGHGAIPIAQCLIDRVDAFGVAVLREAVNLRKARIHNPILILGYTPAESYEELVAYDISQTVFQYEMAEELNEEAKRQGKKARIHIKVDTGMGRIGFFDRDESIRTIKEIAGMENIELEGIFTHFACADETDKASAEQQMKRFNAFVTGLKKEGIDFPLCHAANSAAIIDLPQAAYNMVRSGIATYGLYPSEEVAKDNILLQPALELRTHVVFVKDVEAGCGISYNSTYVTGGNTRIATLPVGYADGYPRSLSSKGRVLIHGYSAKIIGRICMDQMMVDVTDIPQVCVGDAVTLVGRDGRDAIPVEELADMAGSFNYEFICNLSKRVPRIYYRDGRVIGSMDYTIDEAKAVEFSN